MNNKHNNYEDLTKQLTLNYEFRRDYDDEDDDWNPIDEHEKWDSHEESWEDWFKRVTDDLS